jgi:hypothetical protein
VGTEGVASSLYLLNTTTMKSTKVKQILDWVKSTTDDVWIVNALRNASSTKFCMLGHMMLNPAAEHLVMRSLYMYHWCDDLQNLNDTFMYNIKMGIPGVNNGKDPRYQQATPRLRMIAALTDLYKILYLKELAVAVEQAVEETLADIDISDVMKKELIEA